MDSRGLLGGGGWVWVNEISDGKNCRAQPQQISIGGKTF